MEIYLLTKPKLEPNKLLRRATSAGLQISFPEDRLASFFITNPLGLIDVESRLSSLGCWKMVQPNDDVLAWSNSLPPRGRYKLKANLDEAATLIFKYGVAWAQRNSGLLKKLSGKRSASYQSRAEIELVHHFIRERERLGRESI